MGVDEPQTDREWLVRLDGKLDGVIAAQVEMKKDLFGIDGESGICKRVCDLEKQQMKWLGRDGAIVTGISGIVTAFGLFLTWKGGS